MESYIKLLSIGFSNIEIVDDNAQIHPSPNTTTVTTTPIIIFTTELQHSNTDPFNSCCHNVEEDDLDQDFTAPTKDEYLPLKFEADDKDDKLDDSDESLDNIWNGMTEEEQEAYLLQLESSFQFHRWDDTNRTDSNNNNYDMPLSQPCRRQSPTLSVENLNDKKQLRLNRRNALLAMMYDNMSSGSNSSFFSDDTFSSSVSDWNMKSPAKNKKEQLLDRNVISARTA